MNSANTSLSRPQDIYNSGQDGFIDDCLPSLKLSLPSRLISKSSIITTPNKKIAELTKSSILNSSEKSVKTPTMIEKIPKTDILQGCVAFVETWQEGGKYNRSHIFAKMLIRMGAKIEHDFNKDKKLTHLIFKDGRKVFLKKAQQRSVKVVSCNWVEKCRITQTWVQEKPYIFNPHGYKPPKFRESCTFEEKLRRKEVRRKKQSKKNKERKARGEKLFEELLLADGKSPADVPKRKVIAMNTPFKKYQSPMQIKPNHVYETPNYKLQEAMKRIKNGRSCFTPGTDSGDDSKSFDYDKFTNLDIETLKVDDRFSADSNMEFTCLDRNPTIIKNKNHTSNQTKSRSWECSNDSNQQSSLQLSLHWSDVKTNEKNINSSKVLNKISPKSSSIVGIEDSLSRSRRIQSTYNCENLEEVLKEKCISEEDCSQDSSISLHDSENSSVLKTNCKNSLTSRKKRSCLLPPSSSKSLLTNEKSTKQETRSLTQKRNFNNIGSNLRKPAMEQNCGDASPILKSASKRSKAVRKLCDDLINYPASQLINPINHSLSSTPLHVNLRDRKKLRRSVRSKKFKQISSNEKVNEVTGDLSILHKSKQNSFDNLQSALEKIERCKLNDENSTYVYSVDNTYPSRISDDISLFSLNLENKTENLCSFNRDKNIQNNKYKLSKNVNVEGKAIYSSNISSQSSCKSIQSSEYATNNSFEDFISPETRKKQQRAKNKAAKYAVCIRVSQNIRIQLKQITKKLGGSLKRRLLLDDDTTHMVTDETSYHKEIAMACCRGLWVLKPEWLFDCEKQNKFVTPERYELELVCNQQNRLARMKLASYARDGWYQQIFCDITAYVESSVDHNVIKLLQLCGGNTSSNIKSVDVCIGSKNFKFDNQNMFQDVPSKPWVCADWVYKCVYYGQIIPHSTYQQTLK